MNSKTVCRNAPYFNSTGLPAASVAMLHREVGEIDAANEQARARA